MLNEVFNFFSGDLAVMVGGGGKTTLINRLACECSIGGSKTVITTTTKIFPPRGFEYDLVLIDEYADWQQRLADIWLRKKIAVLGRHINEDGKITGLDVSLANRLKSDGLADVILVEGDGSKGKPFKAPRDAEPVVPDLATMVVPVVGIDCIDSTLDEEHFHAVEQISKLTGLKAGEAVGEQAIARILLSAEGYKKNVPLGAQWVPFINKVESSRDWKKALSLCDVLKAAGVEKILVGSAGILGEVELIW